MGGGYTRRSPPRGADLTARARRWFPPLVDDARLFDRSIRFAEDAHRGQVRKGTAIPYVTHVVTVAGLVLAHGYGLRAASVALLHDVLEDTSTEREDLEAVFGSEIARAVADLSEADKIRPWEERKAAYVAHLAHAVELALPACAADKVHNLRSMLWDLEDIRASGGSEDSLWDRFRRRPSRIAGYHRAVVLALRARRFGGPLVDELDRAVHDFAVAVGVDPSRDRFDRP